MNRKKEQIPQDSALYFRRLCKALNAEPGGFDHDGCHWTKAFFSNYGFTYGRLKRPQLHIQRLLAFDPALGGNHYDSRSYATLAGRTFTRADGTEITASRNPS